MNKKSSILCVGVLAFGSLPIADASNITLDFNSLPSAQGFTYISIGPSVNEGSIFSVNGNLLQQNTLGVPFTGSGDSWYNMYNAVNPLLPYTLTITARVTDEVSSNPANLCGLSFGASSGNGISYMCVGTSKTEIDSPINGVATATYYSSNNTQFNTYTIVGTPSLDTKYYVNGTLIATLQPRTDDLSYYNNLSIFLGDGTGGSRAAADISFFQFSQSAAPIPAAIWMVGSALVGLVGFARCKLPL